MAAPGTTPSRSAAGRAGGGAKEGPRVSLEPAYDDPHDDAEAAVIDLDAAEIVDLSQTPPSNDVEEAPPGETDQAEVQRAGLARVQALLTEALRLGTQYGLVTRRPDGSIALPGMQPATQRDSSECTCERCTVHHQAHWWCMVCNSGPHDWMLVKPQFERQTLKPGGIEGVRHAACSAQCAREYLASVGRQPSGVRETRPIDPTLALPMTGT